MHISILDFDRKSGKRIHLFSQDTAIMAEFVLLSMEDVGRRLARLIEINGLIEYHSRSENRLELIALN